MSLSLRTQLLLWFSLAVLLVVFAAVFVTQQVTVWNMEKSVDDALQKRANFVAAIIASDITTDEASYAQVMSELTKQEFPFVPLLLRLVSPHGRIIIEFGKVPDQVVYNLDDKLHLPDLSAGRFDKILIQGIEPLKAYTVSVADPRTHQTLAFVQAIDSLREVAEAKNQLWRNGMIVGLVGSLLALGAGLVLIRRGFRPLGTMLRVINEVDYSHLKTHLKGQTHPTELAQLASSLTAMWQRLDLAVSDREKLIGSVSHDIRTPLTALQGQLEVLLLEPSLTAETRDSLERMLKETRRLARLVKNLLLDAQLKSNPALATEDVNLSELLDEVIGDMWALAKGLELNIVSPGTVRVDGDRDLLKQMLLNIVDNAIKFTPKGGKIELALTIESEWAVLEVSDTGRGVSSDALPHITEAFYKAKTSRTSGDEGAGLGLSIVKQIVELHGGQLEIRSQENVGTSVRVRLPTGDKPDIVSRDHGTEL